jgi:hypothetical protein
MNKQLWLWWKMKVDGKVQEWNVNAAGSDVGHHKQIALLPVKSEWFHLL